ncbi:MAG: helix-turn-helix domain-containing protein [Clostridiales bacterium]|nr:helix-turn-helix domain-containing protein [Clostridiales bacterium]
MYRTLFVYDSDELLKQVEALHIWGEASEFVIEDIANDGITAHNKMKQKKYDLVITEIRITGMDGLQLLRTAKAEGLCSRVVLCSRFSDFNYARQGIILGAYDYFVMPFDEAQFYQMFTRIKSESYEGGAEEVCYKENILAFFKDRNYNIHRYIDEMLDKIYDDEFDVIVADKKARSICSSVIEDLFNIYEWLDLYIDPHTFYNLDSINEGDQNTYKDRYRKILGDLFGEFCRLSPKADDEKIREVIQYILSSPESSLRQKDIAAELHINSTYLSTVFTAHTKIRFVDYVTVVKMKRAAYLLQKTKLKITDISERLGYKDMGYFSRLFKKEYEVPPSEYRMFGDYSYVI